MVAKFGFFMQKYLLGPSLSKKKKKVSEIKKTPDVRTGVVVPKIIFLMKFFLAPATPQPWNPTYIQIHPKFIRDNE